MPTKPRNIDTIIFSLPPEMTRELRRVVKEEGRTVSELLRRPSSSVWRNASGEDGNDWNGCAPARLNGKMAKKKGQPNKPAEGGSYELA